MPTDLEIIKQLGKEIGKKLEKANKDLNEFTYILLNKIDFIK